MRIGFEPWCDIWLGIHEIAAGPIGYVNVNVVLKGEKLNYDFVTVYSESEMATLTHIYRMNLPLKRMIDILAEFAFVEEIIDPSALELSEERFALFLLTYT